MLTLTAIVAIPIIVSGTILTALVIYSAGLMMLSNFPTGHEERDALALLEYLIAGLALLVVGGALLGVL